MDGPAPQSRNQSVDVVAMRLADDMEVIDVFRIVDAVVRERWLVAAVTAIAALAGFAYAFLATSVYQADALLQIEQREGAQLPTDLSLLMQQSTPAEAELQIIRSRSVLMPVIEEQHLDIVVKPQRFPVLGAILADSDLTAGLAPPRLGLDSFAWGGEKLLLDRFDVPPAWWDRQLVLTAGAAGTFTLAGPDGAQLLAGTVGTPVGAPAVGDRLGPGARVDLLVTDLVARPGTRFKLLRQPSLDALEHLRQQFGASESGVDTSIIRMTYRDNDPARAQIVLNGIVERYLTANIQRSSQQAEESLAFIEEQIPTVQNNLTDAEQALSRYRSTAGAIDVSAQAEELIRQYAAVQTRMSELRLKEQELRNLYTANHPQIRALQEQIGELRSDLEKFDESLRSLPQSEREYVELQRDVTVGNELYLQLFAKMQELRVLKAGEIGNVRIVDRAVEPIEPVGPNRPLVIAASLIFGVFAGLAAVYVRRSLDRGVEDPDTLEGQVGLPVYAVIPHSDSLDKLQRNQRAPRHSGDADDNGRSALLARLDPTDVAVEALRSLRTSLQFALMEADNSVVCLTGPAQGIGKTFTAVNLAAVLAAAGQRILLVDTDLRRGQIHRFFALPRAPGLSQAVVGEVPWAAAIRASGIDNLDFLPTGILPPNPSELLMTEEFARGFNDLAARYDMVIVDTPPVLSVGDALVVTRLASTVFFLVKAGATTMQEVRHGVARLRNNGIRVHGFVFNDMPRMGLRRYGYYHYKYE